MLVSESRWPQLRSLEVADIRDGSFAKAEAMKMNVWSWNPLDVLTCASSAPTKVGQSKFYLDGLNSVF